MFQAFQEKRITHHADDIFSTWNSVFYDNVRVNVFYTRITKATMIFILVYTILKGEGILCMK